MNRTPVVFIHGAWLHALSWESWAERFTGQGFLVHVPGWPGEPDTVREARRHPEALRHLGLEALTDHYAHILHSFDHPPVIIGHSVGGLIAQHLLGENLGAAAVAIAPVPVAGAPLATSPTRLWSPGLLGLPGGPDTQVSFSFEQFRHLFANTVGPEETAKLFERHVVPAPSRLLADLGYEGGARHPDTLADTGNTARGPLLLISGQEDRLVPDASTRAVYKLYGDSTAVTTLKQFADRGHSLVVDSGWRTVADHVLGWLVAHGIGAGTRDG